MTRPSPKLALALALLPAAAAAAQDATVPATQSSSTTPVPAGQLTPAAPRTRLVPRPRYLLSPGDTLELNYRFTPSFNQTVTVLPDGYVALNVVGSVKVGGLTLDQAHDEIVRLASAQLNEPLLTLTLKDFTQPIVAVAGEVLKPGKLPFREGETALQAILLAGGWGENAREGQVLLFRRIDTENAEVHVLKLSSMGKQTALERDLPLEPGDMILVQRDRIWKFSRYIKLANIGFYFNPLQNLP